MELHNIDHPWKFIHAVKVFTKEEIRKVSHLIDLSVKKGGIDISNSEEGPFKFIKDRVYEILSNEGFKKEYDLQEPFKLKIRLGRQTEGLKIVNLNAKFMFYFNLTPFREEQPFIRIKQNDRVGKEIKEGFIVSANGEYKSYEFLNVDKMCILSVILSDQTIDSVESTRFSLGGDVTECTLLHRDKFTIFSNFKCGSSTIERWFRTINDPKLLINNIRGEHPISKKHIIDTPNKIFIIRNPYDRFFSGLLQTRVFGSYDIFKNRRVKDGQYYTIPITEMGQGEIVKILKLNINHNPSFLIDKHIKPYLKDYVEFISDNKITDFKICELSFLSDMLNKLNDEHDLGGIIERIDMRGETYPNIDKVNVINNFYDLLYENKNVDEIKHLLNSLEDENRYYKILKSWE